MAHPTHTQQAHRRLEQTLRHLQPQQHVSEQPLQFAPTSGEEKRPIRVLVTGAAGQIAYSILPAIASGYMLGDDQPIILHLLDIPLAKEKLRGVVMELQDCYFPLVREIVSSMDVAEAFDMVEIAILVGAFPRKKGMERAELLAKNASIFSEQGKALAQFAARDVRVCVVGNPANTNCLLALHSSSGLPTKNFTAMTRLDQNRGMGLAREKLNLKGDQDVRNVIIWGNHSANQYPDLSHAVVTNYPEPGLSTSLLAAINDEGWVKSTYIPAVQKRGAKIIEARKLSSAASAANAAVDHVRSWMCGTRPGEVVSMGVLSDGSYGVPEGVVFSFPVTCSRGEWKIVQGLQISDYSRSMMKKSEDELVAEREEALKILGKK